MAARRGAWALARFLHRNHRPGEKEKNALAGCRLRPLIPKLHMPNALRSLDKAFFSFSPALGTHGAQKRAKAHAPKSISRPAAGFAPRPRLPSLWQTSSRWHRLSGLWETSSWWHRLSSLWRTRGETPRLQEHTARRSILSCRRAVPARDGPSKAWRLTKQPMPWPLAQAFQHLANPFSVAQAFQHLANLFSVAQAFQPVHHEVDISAAPCACVGEREKGRERKE